MKRSLLYRAKRLERDAETLAARSDEAVNTGLTITVATALLDVSNELRHQATILREIAELV